MNSRYTACAFVFGLWMAQIAPASAQIPVTDVAAIGQLIMQLQRQEQELAVTIDQLTQARRTYDAFTGSRGMQRLLSGVQRNYLPRTAEELARVLGGESAVFPALSAEVRALIEAGAVLSADEVRALEPGDQDQLAKERRAAAAVKAFAREQITNTSERFESLQQLIDILGRTNDPKASIDLTARIAAEQTMLTNEANKLRVLDRALDAERYLNEQRRRERSIQAIGSLRLLPELGLQ